MRYIQRELLLGLLLLNLWLPFTPFYFVVYTQRGCRTLKYQAYLVNVVYQAGALGGPHGFFVISQLFDSVDYSDYVFFCLWNYNSVIQALLASNILFIYFSRS